VKLVTADRPPPNMSLNNILDKYEINFDLVLNHTEVSKHFEAYLTKYLNLEGYLFIQAVNEFRNTFNVDRKISLVHEIVNKMIRYGSEKEINVEGRLKEQVLKTFDQNKQGENNRELKVPVTIFDAVYQVVYREFKDDTFPRYKRSNELRQLITQHGENLLKEIAIDISETGAANALMFKPNDFSSNRIIDRDIKFILKLLEDSSDWEAIHIAKASEPFDAFLSKTKYAIGEGSQGLKLSKVTFCLPYSAEDALASYTHHIERKMADPMQKNFDILDHIQATDENCMQYSISVEYYDMDMAFFLRRRVLNKYATVIYDTVRNCYIWLGKTSRSLDNAYKDKKKDDGKRKVIGDLIFGFAFFKISENKCRFAEVVYGDFKLPFNSDLLFSKMVKKRAQQMYKGTLKLCIQQEKRGFPRPEGHCLLDTLDDFKQRFLSNENSVKTWSLDNE